MNFVATSMEPGAQVKTEEVVILGTSPILLIEALFRTRAGQKVTMIEAKDCIGGAWSHVDVMDLADIEGACHLMVNYRGVYDFLNNACGIAMEECSPQPLLIERQRLVPFNSRRVALRRFAILAMRTGMVSVIRVLEALLPGGWRLERTRGFGVKKALAALSTYRLLPIFGSTSQRDIRYPVGGAPAMLHNLRSELQGKGARFIHGKAERLILPANKDGNLRIKLESGDEIWTRTLVVSESSEIGSLDSPQGYKQFQAREKAYDATIVRVSGAKDRLLSYVELPHDTFVERVTDVTDYCRGADLNGNRILVFEQPGAFGETQPRRPAQTVLNYLKSIKVLPDSLEVVEEAPHQLVMRRSDGSLIEHLRKNRNGSVVIVPSRGDFSLSIARNMRRWGQYVLS